MLYGKSALGSVAYASLGEEIVVSADITLPSLTINVLAHLAVDADITFPQFTTSLAGHLPADADLTFAQLSVQGGSGATGVVNLQLNVLSLGADTAIIDITLPLLNVQVLGGAMAEISLPQYTIQALAGALVNITFPQFSLSGAGRIGEIGNTDFTLPIITVLSKAYRGTIPKCLVMNLTNFAVSEFLNYPFNSFTKFNGQYLAANANGIYELDESSTDDGGYSINFNIKSGIVDTYSDKINRLRDAYILYKSDGDIRLSTKADKKIKRRYIIPQQINGISKTIKKRRVKFERGIKNRYCDFEIENINGSSLEIESVRVFLEPVISKRR